MMDLILVCLLEGVLISLLALVYGRLIAPLICGHHWQVDLLDFVALALLSAAVLFGLSKLGLANRLTTLVSRIESKVQGLETRI